MGPMPSDTLLRGTVVCLPDAPVDDHIGVVEVLIQEGFRTFAAPVTGAALSDLTAIFGARAAIGVTRVVDAAQVVTAVEKGAAFVLADVATNDVAQAALEAGVPCYGAAMTPGEVRAALALPLAGVLVGHCQRHLKHELTFTCESAPCGNLVIIFAFRLIHF